MASKLSSGELNQENLMKDAMKFATMMPGMFGNQTGGGTSCNPGGGANMGNMMSMFADLMANNNDNEMPDLNAMKNMAQNMGGKQKKGGKNSFNESAYRKIAAQKKLKKKLATQKKELKKDNTESVE